MKVEIPDRQLEDPIPKNIFLAEVNYWASKIGVEPTEVIVRKMTNKWGSCSAGGRVSFNNELLWHPPRLRKRVIIEQLLELRQPEGGEQPDSVLETYLSE